MKPRAVKRAMALIMNMTTVPMMIGLNKPMVVKRATNLNMMMTNIINDARLDRAKGSEEGNAIDYDDDFYDDDDARHNKTKICEEGNDP